MVVHWGGRYRRTEIGAKAWVLLAALFFDVIVLAAFTAMNLESVPMIVVFAVGAIFAVFTFRRMYLSRWIGQDIEPAD